MIQDTQFQFSLFTWAQLLTLFFQQAVNPRAAAQSAVQPEPSFASHHTWDPSIAAMVGALFCAFLFMGFVSVYLRHCTEGYVNTAGQNQIGGSGGEWPCSCSQGIDRQVLNTFPILVYSTIKDLKIGKGSLECAVCLSEFKDLDTLRLLPKCDHVFHPDCIDAWLSSHVTCPVCREKLDPAGSADDEVAVTVQSPSSIPNETNEENPNPTEEHAETERQHQVDHVNIVNEDEGESSVNSREDDAVSSVDDDDDDDEKQNPPLESGRGRLVELRRSNSTGHCEVELGAKNTTTERYTLRLPYDVRRYILLNHGNMMRRSASYNVIMLSEGSKRDNVERWMMSRTPPFLCRQA